MKKANSEISTKSSAKKMTGRGKGSTSKSETTERKNIPASVALRVLLEAGYRCAIPVCRNTLALDMHHIWQVSDGGQNDPANLIALCSYCHDLHHRGVIPADAIKVYKALLVSLTQAYEVEGLDRLIFLSVQGNSPLIVGGDGVLLFARLIANGLASFKPHADNNGQLVTYRLQITEKGQSLMKVWQSGDRGEFESLIRGGTATVRKFAHKQSPSKRPLTDTH